MESNDDERSSKKVVFVTVGTTLFDALVRAVDTQEVKEELYAKGYTHLLIQIGRGSYIPSRVSVNLGPVATLSPMSSFFNALIASLLKTYSCIIKRKTQLKQSLFFDSFVRELDS